MPTSIDRTIRTALVAEFGSGADLSEVTLAEIEDVVLSALLSAGRGREEAEESAVRIAARLDGTVI